MITTLTTLQTYCTNPFKNLATEEYLLHRVKENECILYLWQNKHTVVIGRNQNCYKECRIRELIDSGGHLVRRLSGGGAVYHDLGNLNFTFFVQKENYDLDKQLSVIITALNSFGIPAEKSGRNDITVDGKKVSGNAFYHTGNRCYHHGTLLVDVNLLDLSRYLTVSADKMKSHGVDSVRSRVINLKELNTEITIKSLSHALISAFKDVYHQNPVSYIQSEDTMELNPLLSNGNEELLMLEDKFSSWEWRFGRPIEFQNEMIKRFSWGEVLLQFRVNQGMITDVALFSDAIDTELLPLIQQALQNTEYRTETICLKIDSIPVTESIQMKMKADLMFLIKENLT